MAKFANAGELRTPIIVEKKETETVDSEGYRSNEWINVFGENKTCRVKWINAHGNEVYEAMRMDLNEPATLTARYSSLITPQCRVLLAADASKTEKDSLYYEIISIDDVENRHQWLEIKVKRQVGAR